MNSLRACLLASLALVTATPLLRADDPGATSSLEAGAAYGKLKIAGTSADLAGGAAAINFEIGKFLNTDLGLRVDYTHLESNDTLAFKRDAFGADIRFGLSLVGIIKPFVTGGVAYERNSAPAYTPKTGWQAGGAVGAGVAITLVPGLLHTTPSVRYVESDKLKTITYALDTALHFSVVGVGLRLSYEDNRSRDAHLETAALYAALRF